MTDEAEPKKNESIAAESKECGRVVFDEAYLLISNSKEQTEHLRKLHREMNSLSKESEPNKS